MAPLVNTRDQRTVETVGFTWRAFTKEGTDYPMDWKVDGHRFLGFKRCNLHRLPGERLNGPRALLFELLGRIEVKLLNKALFWPRKEMKIFFHHHNALAHISAFATVKLAELGYELLKAVVRTSHWERVSEILSSTD